MFEVGFFELAVIFGVALVVLGPTRLPGLVRNVGRWVGKARSMARQFREQLESEVNVEELNRSVEELNRIAQGNPSRNGDMTEAPVPPDAAPQTTAAAAEETPPESAPTDDAYSHAHAEGAAPMYYQPEPADLGPADPEVVASTETPAPSRDDEPTRNS